MKDRSKYGILINASFKKKRVNVHRMVDSHSSNLYHIIVMADSSIFVLSVEQNVEVCINSALAKNIEENRHNSLFC